MQRRRDARFADDRIVNPHDVIPQRPGFAGRSVHRVAAAADDRRCRAYEPRVAGLRRFGHVAASALGKTRHDGARVCGFLAEPAQNVGRLAKRARVCDCRSRGDHAEIVSDHVRDGKRPARAGRACREPAALDRRQVLPHGVEGVNISAGAKQAVGGRALVVERDAGRGNGHQRRRAAREEDDQCLVGLKRRGERERPPTGLLAAGCRHRMPASNRLEGRRHAARLRADDEAAANSRSEQASGGLGHRDRGFAGRNDAQSAIRQRITRRERALEQSPGRGGTEPSADNGCKVLSKN